MWIVVLVVLLLLVFLAFQVPTTGMTIGYGQFVKLAEDGAFDSITIFGDTKIVGKFKKDPKGEVIVPEEIKPRKVDAGRCRHPPHRQNIRDDFPNSKDLIEAKEDPFAASRRSWSSSSRR